MYELNQQYVWNITAAFTDIMDKALLCLRMYPSTRAPRQSNSSVCLDFFSENMKHR